jgi:quercetin dioxygenase-like cupin family protein
MSGINLEAHPIHLGLGATAVVEPRFTGGIDWYQGYVARHAADGAEGRLVSLHAFDKPWDVWEMHPSGAEVVLCTSGSITLRQERSDGTVVSVELQPGQYAINEPGVWHTADVVGNAQVVFVTAGVGTQHRPR